MYKGWYQMNMIYNFDTKEPIEVAEIGSKSLKLIEMYQKGLAVPKGLALSIKFFENWIKQIEEHPCFLDIANNLSNNLNNSCKTLKSFAYDLDFSKEQKSVLNSHISNLKREEVCEFFAVRSSSPEEDMSTASFAGGYETVLGVREEGLFDAIKACFISALDKRVFSYKKEHGIQIKSINMAVLIQHQIKAEVAGVGFSLNPLNNCYDEAVINSNYGLGETVVSGIVEPDTIVIDKYNHQVIQSSIGTKTKQLFLNDFGGITEKNSLPSKQLCLSNKLIGEIIYLMINIEDIYKMPVDIEWAMSKENLYLLQVRPITTYHPLPDEMITKPGEQKKLYANSTLIEQGLTKPLSVLGTSFVDYVLRQMGSSTGGDIAGVDGMAFTCGGQYYMNITNAISSGSKKMALAPGSSDDEAMLSILNNIDLNIYKPKKVSPQIKKSKRKMLFSVLPMLSKILKASKNPVKFMDKYYTTLPEKLKVFNRDFDNSLTLHQKAKTLTAHLDYFLMETGMPAFMLTLNAKKNIKNLFKDISNIDDHLINITMMLPHNKTTEMGRLLYKLASYKELKIFDDSKDFIKAFDKGLLSKDFMNDFNHYVDEFGGRCHAEIDVATIRPRESLKLVFKQIKETSLSIDKNSVSVFERAVSLRENSYEYLIKIAASKGKGALRKFKKYYNIIYNYGGFRESGKQYITRAVELFRQEALLIAQMWVKDNRINNLEQIFDLTVEDIDKALVDKDLDLLSLIDKNTAFIKKLKKSKHTVRMIDSRGKIFYPPANKVQDGSLIGAVISPGKVKGIARVFHSPEDKILNKGEILVAKATDPGWTPLFVNANGIVLEIGGALQHGAVVAREYGIPCVSGISNVTSIIKDGDFIEVDGSNGTIKIIKENKCND